MIQEQRADRKIQVNGVKIVYRFDGRADGRVVMLSNSLMADYSMWDGNVPALADRYRVLRYDTRGQGRSGTTPGPYALGLLAEDAIALLDALGIPRVHFVGLSMGGMIGQQLGARFPDRVHSLALCDTTSEMPLKSVWDERIAIVTSQGVAGLVDTTIKRWFTEELIARYPETIARISRMISRTGDEGYIACAYALRELAQTEMLRKIETPTLVLVGREDPACTVEQSTVIHRMIAGSQLVVLENAAHLSNVEQPRAFNAALRAFIDRVDDSLPAS